jgi:quaternary ammonium compound-resistance protein SugE
MAWVYLLAASMCEVAATTIYRFTEGLTRVWPTTGLALLGVFSLYLLHRAVSPTAGEAIPIGTAYAVWTGIGAAGTVIVGMVAFGEPYEALRILLLILIIGSIVGLKLISGV